MSDTFATVGYDSDEDYWSVCYGDKIHSKHETKEEAIETATDIDPVNSVMAFTKGNSNVRTIQA